VLLNIRLTRRIETTYYFPSKLMEYLASGAPVITTCPGHVRDEFSELAFLVEDESAEGLADVIRAVAAMPGTERDSRARKARAFMAEHRTWTAQAKRIVEFLKDLDR
jgi:glycosyltransferase involved in cell wall biosynthesis